MLALPPRIPESDSLAAGVAVPDKPDKKETPQVNLALHRRH